MFACLMCCFSSVYMGFFQPSIHYFALTTIVCTGLVCLPACLLAGLLYTRYQIEWLAGWLVGWLAELTNDDCGWMMDPCMYMAQLNTHSTTQASQSRCVYFFTLYRQAVSPPANQPYSYISIHRTTIIIIHSYCLLAMLYAILYFFYYGGYSVCMTRT